MPWCQTRRSRAEVVTEPSWACPAAAYHGFDDCRRFDARAAAGALRTAREDRAHGLRAALRVRRCLPRGWQDAFRARPAVDYARHGRRSLARNGAEQADRRAHRRAQSAHSRPRAAEWAVVGHAGGRVLCCGARALPRSGLATRTADAPAVADPRRGLRRLPLPQALDLALPPLARRCRRTRTGRRVGRDYEPSALGSVGARCRGGALGRRLRSLLRVLRRRDRSRAASALGRDALRRARRV